MWIKKNNKSYSVTDESRFEFKTTISKAWLEQLFEMAEKHDTYPNYLIETGLRKVVIDGYVEFNKKDRPKDRIYYKSSYDKELIQKVKMLAQQHQLKYNDVIEYSFRFIDPEKAKKKNHRNRVE